VCNCALRKSQRRKKEGIEIADKEKEEEGLANWGGHLGILFHHTFPFPYFSE
jgi:hypothetical protein